MASTNPFLEHSSRQRRADAPKRGLRSMPERQRWTTRRQKRQRIQPKDSSGPTGWPEFEGLKPVLTFLAAPAFILLLIVATGGGWPKPILYSIAAVLGFIVVSSALKGVELVLACMLIYLPFSKVFVVPIAPGLNGTNMLILLGFFAAVIQLRANRQRIVDMPAGSIMVFIFGIWTALSAFTVLFIPGGRTMLLFTEILSYKAWVDQFIFYFILLVCIRDAQTAKRCVIYLMMGTMLVILYSIPEMIAKAGRSTIDKSRIVGPQLQSNNFGGFVAYTVLPIMAMFVVHMRDIRAWILVPYFLLTAKVLITTFSRGAYLAMAAGAFVLAWYRGKGFLAFWSALLLCALLAFPSLVPNSIQARMGALLSNDRSSSSPVEEKVDKSSNNRLILWAAAIRMIQEDPVFGKGFKAFPMLKAEYTTQEVRETDPHSMYLYLGSQMGLPALFLFLAILAYCVWLGQYHSKNKDDMFVRAIGIGGASMTVCLAVVCVFGSRAVSLNFTVYFWTMMVVMQVLRHVELQEAKVELGKRRARMRDNAPSESRSLAVAESPESVSESRLQSKQQRRGARRGAAAYQARDRDSMASPEATDKSDVQETPDNSPSDQMSGRSRLASKSRPRKLKLTPRH